MHCVKLYPHADSSLLQVSIEFLCLSITMVQFLFTTLNSLFRKKCNRLKARVVIYAYNHHVRLLSPEPEVVDKPQSTRVEEPTLLCNHLISISRNAYQDVVFAGQNFLGLRMAHYRQPNTS